MTETTITFTAKELLIMKSQLLASSQPVSGTPFIPMFTGEDKGVYYRYWREVIVSIKDGQQYKESYITQLIRKYTGGKAAKRISILPLSASIDEVLEALDIIFKDTTTDATSWKAFYNAHQEKREDIIDWFTRLESLWSRAPTSTVDMMEKHQIIKSQLWTGLHDKPSRSNQETADNV